MKQYLFSVVALTSFAALHGAALTPNLAASVGARCSFATPDHSYCSLPRPGLEVKCFKDKKSVIAFEAQRTSEDRSCWNSFFSRYESFLSECFDDGGKQSELLEAGICPLEDESLDNYVYRALTRARQEGSKAAKQTSMQIMHERSVFWLLPWQMHRYLFSVAVELGYINPNDTLSVSKQTLLDHAAQNKDEEMIFWLWDKGAREANHADTMGYIGFDVMLKTKDERSLAVLKSMVDEGRKLTWFTTEWATNLDPEFALKKIYIITDARIVGREMRSKWCIPRSSVKSMSDATPGEKALKDWLMKTSDWLNCHTCQIQ